MTGCDLSSPKEPWLVGNLHIYLGLHRIGWSLHTIDWLCFPCFRDLSILEGPIFFQGRSLSLSNFRILSSSISGIQCLSIFILVCYSQRQEYVLRCNLLSSRIVHFGLLKDVNEEFKYVSGDVAEDNMNAKARHRQTTVLDFIEGWEPLLGSFFGLYWCRVSLFSQTHWCWGTQRIGLWSFFGQVLAMCLIFHIRNGGCWHGNRFTVLVRLLYHIPLIVIGFIGLGQRWAWSMCTFTHVIQRDSFHNIVFGR